MTSRPKKSDTAMLKAARRRDLQRCLTLALNACNDGADVQVMSSLAQANALALTLRAEDALGEHWQQEIDKSFKEGNLEPIGRVLDALGAHLFPAGQKEELDRTLASLSMAIKIMETGTAEQRGDPLLALRSAQNYLRHLAEFAHKAEEPFLRAAGAE